MKVESIGKKNIIKNSEQGSSILEMLIAIAVLTLGISSVIMLVFANQSVTLDSTTSGEALYKAKKLLEDARASSTADFNSVISAATTSDDIYFKKFDATDLTPCRKEIISRTQWSTEKLRPQKIELKTDITDIAEAFARGGDCAAEPPPPEDDWSNSDIFGAIDLEQSTTTEIDVKGATAYISTKAETTAKDDFYSIDVGDPTTPMIVGRLDTGPGLNAIDVATSTNGHLYAYAANNDTAHQLQIIDITNSAHPVLAASSTLPLMTAGIARSIYYYNKKVYIGTQYLSCPACTPAQNNEFHIFDVSDPTNPQWKGSIKVNRNVNAILVRSGIAYVATGPGSSSPYTPLHYI